jgi:S1-C subfamily serine protease
MTARCGSQRARGGVLACLLAAAAGVLAGCGGSSHTTVQTVTQSSPPSPAVQPARASGVGTGGFNASAVYARDAPGVVTVISLFPGGSLNGLLGGGGGGTAAAQGSGFVVSSAGEVITNAHVITNGTGGSLQRAKSVYVKFPDGNEVPAAIVGADPNADVALLRISPAGLALAPLPLGSSSDLVVGQPVAAMGTPFGQQGSLSVGVISALNRSIQSLNVSGSHAFDISGAIQTDAAINHGNSGGPLVDARGAVIGINSQIDTQNGAGSGVGFAVPVDAVKHSLAQLRAHGSVAYAYLGVSSLPLFPQLASRLGLKVGHGALLDQVTPGGPSAAAGLQGASGQVTFDAQRYPAGGDVVTKVNGRNLTQNFDLASAVAQLNPGQKVTLEVWSRGSRRDVTVTLGTRPGSG